MNINVRGIKTMNKPTRVHGQKAAKKLVMGVLVAAATVLVGTAGVANATSGHGHGHGSNGSVTGIGYGGNVSVNVGDIVGDNNVINVIVRYIFG
ncbi:hypothetical protein TM7_0240 [candidate division TM7 genomosp. GTL1]|nr:hypothetical protein TM7_0240 [candidate division TM7 genomosp. GTL1]